MFHGHLDYSWNPPLGGRPNIKPRNHCTPNAHKQWFILFYHVWETRMNRQSLKIAFGWRPGHIWLHTTLQGPWPHYMILKVCWDSLWTLSCGLSQSRGHGSWLVCEVAVKFTIAQWVHHPSWQWNLTYNGLWKATSKIYPSLKENNEKTYVIWHGQVSLTTCNFVPWRLYLSFIQSHMHMSC